MRLKQRLLVVACLGSCLVGYLTLWKSNSPKGPPFFSAEELSLSHDQPTSLQTFRERSLRLSTLCASLGADRNQSRHARYPFRMLRVKSLSFCSLPKTGSTFWRRVLYYLDRNLTAPFSSVEFGDIHAKTNYLSSPARQKKQQQQSSEPPKRIVFVREPYARLFSAYVDKLFKPKAANWIYYATPVMALARPFASQTDRRCSHNVLFNEFVQFFINSELGTYPGKRVRRDEHFVPVSQQCAFCSTPFDFIGHQETFAQDTLGILAQLNLSGLLTPDDLLKGYERYELDALVRYIFEHEVDYIAKTLRCMSKNEILRRIWKFLQIRGTLRAQEYFPLADYDVASTDKHAFLRLALAAFNRSRDDVSRARNEKESLHEAYSSVPLKDRLLLRQIFADDFKLFGYDPDHPLVFPPDDEFVLPPHRYFDVFDSFLYTDIA